MTPSKNYDIIFLILVIIYFFSFFLPAYEIGFVEKKIHYGYETALLGIFFFGLAIPAHISTFGVMIHRISMQHPENPNLNFTGFFLFLSILGSLLWLFVLPPNDTLLIGYFVWAFSSISLVFVYRIFRIRKSEESTESKEIIS